MTANVYAGVNAHLNSYLQAVQGEWLDFHARHIVHIDEALKTILPAGYRSYVEASLQIVQRERVSQSRADVLVYRQTPPSGATATTGAAAFAVPILDADDTPEDVETSIVVYRGSGAGGRGDAVTRIEVLSPANKRGGSHYRLYRRKRLETLHAGVNLVEIDYLHEQPPISTHIPSYARGDEGAMPYLVLVSTPQPTVEEGVTTVYGAAVDAPLPVFALPLALPDAIDYDLNPVYARTYASAPQLDDAIRYAEPPPAFERYSADDQARIRAVMARAAQAGA